MRTLLVSRKSYSRGIYGKEGFWWALVRIGWALVRIEWALVRIGLLLFTAVRTNNRHVLLLKKYFFSVMVLFIDYAES